MGVQNPDLVRLVGGFLAAIAALAMIPAFALLALGFFWGWSGMLLGLVTFSAAALNYVISSEVCRDKRAGSWLFLVFAVSAVLLSVYVVLPLVLA